MLRIADEVRDALAVGGAVVALETTIVAHGFPPGEGLAVGRECEVRVRAAGAVPATVAVLDGEVCVGLSDSELERVATGTNVVKVGPGELGACVASGGLGATTVGGTLTVCRKAGIRFMATGGLGGVHRGYAERPDISADLGALAGTEAVVVCSGIKSLLDVGATLEALETLGVPVLGWQTYDLPLFYSASGGPRVRDRVDTVQAVTAVARAHWEFSNSAIVLARPPTNGLDDVEPMIEQAVAEAARRGAHGKSVTPVVLSILHELSGGRTLEVNRRLAADNAGLAGEIAVAFSG